MNNQFGFRITLSRAVDVNRRTIGAFLDVFRYGAFIGAIQALGQMQ